MRTQPQRAGHRFLSRGPRAASYFADEMDAQDSANSLGLHVKVGYQIVAESVAYPFPEHYARQIRAEIDPEFRPLWINQLWKSPNGGDVWTGHHMLARFVAVPRESAPRIKHLTLPTWRTYGIRYENPLLESDILDGLTDKERDAGELPRFEEFTGLHLQSMRRAMWMRNHLSVDERIAANAEAERLAILARRRTNDANGRARLRERARERQVGTGERVYVSSNLLKFREAAGLEVVQ